MFLTADWLDHACCELECCSAGGVHAASSDEGSGVSMGPVQLSFALEGGVDTCVDGEANSARR